MNILSWNCCGLKQSTTVQELIALVRAKSPVMVFLMKTRSASRAMNLKWRLGLKMQLELIVVTKVEVLFYSDMKV
jgi:hypothetical protein